MFYHYEIKNNKNEEVLYLYLSFQQEFAKEFNVHDTNELSRRAKNFIDSRGIPFHGNKVYLVVDGVVVKGVQLSEDQQYLPDQTYSLDSFIVPIHYHSSFCEISLREYLQSILFSYYDDDIPDEVYKCIGLLFSTYAYKMIQENKYIEEDHRFFTFQPLSTYKNKYPSYDTIVSHFNYLLEDINGLFLKYKNDFIYPFIHYCNSGKTKENKHYPYLSSVYSLWDYASCYALQIKDYTYQEVSQIIHKDFYQNSIITIRNHGEENKVFFDDQSFYFEEIQQMFSLKSTDFYFILYHDHLRIITKGFGHSLGLSLFGACELAKDGLNYVSIIHYYFPKVKFYQYTKRTP